ncbi:hypothetical protein RCC89_07475 [Cytophagaceae bacterium ABcell3]|nr:hypothetical protein RCC89_07475 [Cytophagaceae bacterium ABcell3]
MTNSTQHFFKEKTEAEFELVNESGISGFPTLILKKGEGDYHIITTGWTKYKKIQKALDKQLRK